jgi:hypothetical protein
MDILGKDDIKILLENKSDPSISLFIPTHKEWNEMDQDLIRYKNQISTVEKRLAESGMRSKEIEMFLKPAKDLFDNKEFWNHQSEGLAVYFNEHAFFTYRLPIRVNEFLFINNIFYIKPLLPLLSADGRYFVLAFDQTETKFYECTKYTINEIPIKDVPTNLDEALKWDDPEKSLQFHSSTGDATSKGGVGGKRSAMFHGQGVGGDDNYHKKNLQEFAQVINRGVDKILSGETAPLIIASVEYLIPIYKDANSYNYLYSNHLTINPQELNENELHEKSYKLIKPKFEEDQQKAYARYEQLSGNSKASSNIEEIVKAAHNKRIEYLWVNLDRKQWGIFDEEKQTIEFNDEPLIKNKELLDVAAGKTLINNGTVYALHEDKMPIPKAAIAVFRF